MHAKIHETLSKAQKCVWEISRLKTIVKFYNRFQIFIIIRSYILDIEKREMFF